MSLTSFLTSALLHVLILYQATIAKYSSGVLETSKNWAYLERFCFVSEAGNLQYFLQYPASCKEKEDLLDPNNNQVVRLSPHGSFEVGASCGSFERDNETWYRCHANRSFFSMRPRWWYMAVGNCDAKNGLYLEYSILMTNAEPSNRWFHHFSFDEFYVLPICIFFMVVELLVLIAAVVFTCILKARNLLHTTYKLFLHALAFELVSVVMLWFHYDRYADDGYGFPMIRYFGLLSRQLGTVLFVFLLLLVAKGYTITRAKISRLSTLKVMCFISVFLLLQTLAVIWEMTMFDPAQVTYMSESIAAYLIAALRILAWLWLLRSSYVTPNKKFFYLPLAVLLTFWFLAGPVMLVVANFLLDNWVRAEVAIGVESAVMAYGFIIFLTLTCPLPNNFNFPYHVRTNQITTLTNFPQHMYEVQYTPNNTNSTSTGSA
ncbi:Rhodopsin-like GPCR protein transmembrane domain containing protein [Aphelenchoides avenae]|nr:Rhodopsin-like GPCR protein transmembrane domain containing protein [Aphelenchus avenae]